ncbi:hypothetical protein KIW84_035250 [Lathyrus oleraceus]|uniref:Uncharacterized protein n=1 Tax=Pisum sativum TaxID=3888 RepID=A0A9D4Y1I7_PEA|nr:hypothetical protein KIW84_035250 [Pisum sativum]
MDYGRRNTKKYSFRCPNLRELRKLASFILDPLDFKQLHGKLLSILSTDVVEGLLSVLVHLLLWRTNNVYGGLRDLCPSLGSLEIIDSCGEFSNVPLIGTQGLESKDKDALIELLEDRVTKRQREPEVSSSSMPQPSITLKKIVHQFVLEKNQMKTSFETEIRRTRRKYAPSARSSNIVVRDP